MPATTIKDREIFAIGTWRGSKTITANAAMLDEIVSNYSELNSKVGGYAIAIKIGHNRRVGEPAFGYAENVRRDGNVLLADFTDVPSEIVDALQAKRYNAVSVELWPEINYEGRTFSNVLGGVALLGAEWPAVKGLKPVYAFHATEGVPLILSQEEEMPNTLTQEQHDTLLAAAVETAVATEKGRADQAEARALTAETALSLFHEEKEKADLTAIIEAAEVAGKIVPANKPKVVAFADTLRKSIKAEDRTAILTQFKEFVENLPVRVEFIEKGRADDRDEAVTASDEVMAATKKKQTENAKLSFADAMALVFAENPDLKTRYTEERR